jgi:hypothetical protein
MIYSAIWYNLIPITMTTRLNFLIQKLYWPKPTEVLPSRRRTAVHAFLLSSCFVVKTWEKHICCVVSSFSNSKPHPRLSQPNTKPSGSHYECQIGFRLSFTEVLKLLSQFSTFDHNKPSPSVVTPHVCFKASTLEEAVEEAVGGHVCKPSSPRPGRIPKVKQKFQAIEAITQNITGLWPNVYLRMCLKRKRGNAISMWWSLGCTNTMPLLTFLVNHD